MTSMERSPDSIGGTWEMLPLSSPWLHQVSRRRKRHSLPMNVLKTTAYYSSGVRSHALIQAVNDINWYGIAEHDHPILVESVQCFEQVAVRDAGRSFSRLQLDTDWCVWAHGDQYRSQMSCLRDVRQS